ncbi:MAG: hypothetical protein FWF24_02680 [Alphaproteobacteria bacterium]|nr:hypothetical protein [Alphaproteobacteria bacterium]
MNRALDLFRFDNWAWPFMEEQIPQLKLLTPDPDPEITIEPVEFGQAVSSKLFLLTEKGHEPIYVRIGFSWENKPGTRDTYKAYYLDHAVYYKEIERGSRHYQGKGDILRDSEGRGILLSLAHQKAFQDYFWKTRYERDLALIQELNVTLLPFDTYYRADPSLTPYQLVRGRPRQQERIETKPEPQ